MLSTVESGVNFDDLPIEVLRLIFNFAVGSPEEYSSLCLVSASFCFALSSGTISDNTVTAEIQRRVLRKATARFLIRETVDVNIALEFFLNPLRRVTQLGLHYNRLWFLELRKWANTGNTFVRVVALATSFSEFEQVRGLCRRESNTLLRLADVSGRYGWEQHGPSMACVGALFVGFLAVFFFCSCLKHDVEFWSLGLCVCCGIVTFLQILSHCIWETRLENCSLALDRRRDSKEGLPESEWTDEELESHDQSILERLEAAKNAGLIAELTAQEFCFKQDEQGRAFLKFEPTRGNADDLRTNKHYQSVVIVTVFSAFFYVLLFPLLYFAGLATHIWLPLTWNGTILPILTFLLMPCLFVLGQFVLMMTDDGSHSAAEISVVAAAYVYKLVLIFLSWHRNVPIYILVAASLFFCLFQSWKCWRAEVDWLPRLDYIGVSVSTWWMAVTWQWDGGSFAPVFVGLPGLILLACLAVACWVALEARSSLRVICPYMFALLNFSRGSYVDKIALTQKMQSLLLQRSQEFTSSGAPLSATPSSFAIREGID